MSGFKRLDSIMTKHEHECGPAVRAPNGPPHTHGSRPRPGGHRVPLDTRQIHNRRGVVVHGEDHLEQRVTSHQPVRRQDSAFPPPRVSSTTSTGASRSTSV